jgi:nucleoside-diphosphate-sugar epimerase
MVRNGSEVQCTLPGCMMNIVFGKLLHVVVTLLRTVVSCTIMLHLQDVARAHIRAAEVPSASGRYVLSRSSATRFQEVIDWLQV